MAFSDLRGQLIHLTGQDPLQEDHPLGALPIKVIILLVFCLLKINISHFSFRIFQLCQVRDHYLLYVALETVYCIIVIASAPAYDGEPAFELSLGKRLCVCLLTMITFSFPDSMQFSGGECQ